MSSNATSRALVAPLKGEMATERGYYLAVEPGAAKRPAVQALARPSQVIEFVRSVPSDVCVVIDEAYIEFVQGAERDKLLPLAIDHDNVVITRTFAKIYGLAGLRVGYGFAPLALRLAVS